MDEDGGDDGGDSRGDGEEEENEGEEGEDKDDEDDPLGMEKVLIHELQRRQIAKRVPFSETLTTFLGPDALLCE